MKLALPLLLLFALFISSCSGGKGKATGDEPMVGAGDEPGLELNSDSDSGKAGPLQTVRFAYNSAALTDDAKGILATNAKFLTDNQTVEVQVEGHCDERGGVQYNLALGEKRAKAVISYLVAAGVPAARLGSPLSFGKERPIAFGHNEDAWGQNRRANFVITAK